MQGFGRMCHTGCTTYCPLNRNFVGMFLSFNLYLLIYQNGIQPEIAIVNIRRILMQCNARHIL